MNIAKHLEINYEINKNIIVSTGHLSDDTRISIARRDADVNQLCIYNKTNYGWFIVVPYDDGIPESTPEDLKSLLQIAKNHNCYYLEIDCDGPRYDNLPYYHD